jgi:hypothetical protein
MPEAVASLMPDAAALFAAAIEGRRAAELLDFTGWSLDPRTWGK